MSTIRNWHPAADAFPMLEGPEFQRFVEDIKANGVRKPIEVYDGERWTEYKGVGIDGRNRHAACLALGIDPPVKTLTDADLGTSESPVTSYIVSVNVARRHLSSSQAAVVGVEIKRQLEVEGRARRFAALDRGRDTQKEQRSEEWVPQNFGEPTSAQISERTHDRESAKQAAMIVGTNRQYIADVEKIEAEAPKLVARIRAGSLKVWQARTALKQREQAPEAFAALEEGRIGFAGFRTAYRQATAAPVAENAVPAAEGDRQIADELGPVFADVPMLLAFGTSLAQLLDSAGKLDSTPGARQINVDFLRMHLKNALRVVAEGIPYEECPRLHAPPEEVNDGLTVCPLCQNTKYLSTGIHVGLMKAIDQWDVKGLLRSTEASPGESGEGACAENEAGVV